MNPRSVLWLAVSLLSTPLIAQTSLGSAPAGVLSFDVPAGLSGMSCPLIPAELAAGAIASNTTSDLTFVAAAGAIGPLLTSGQACYVEILSGPYVGERFDVDTAATIAAGDSRVVLSLGTHSQTTLATLDFSLAGVQAAVRTHITLAALASCFSPALTGSDDPTLADGVRIYGGDGFTFYYLRADGVTWSTAGVGADQRNLVIPPDVSLGLELRSGARAFTQMGLVRTTAFRKNLRDGYQAFAIGYPVDCTPAQIGAYVETAQAAGLRWTGSNSAANADATEIFVPAANSFVRYYLRGDGASWRRLGRTENVADTPLLRIDALLMLHRTKANVSYRISPPFTL